LTAFPCTCTITDAGDCERDLACPVCGDAAEDARAERGERLARDWFLPPAAAEYAREQGRTAARATLAKDYSRSVACPWELSGPSLTRARLAHAWVEGLREVRPTPTGELPEEE
jgi:hypothetical protein